MNKVIRIDRGIGEAEREILAVLIGDDRILFHELTGPVRKLLKLRMIQVIPSGPGYELRITALGKKIETHCTERDLRIGRA